MEELLRFFFLILCQIMPCGFDSHSIFCISLLVVLAFFVLRFMVHFGGLALQPNCVSGPAMRNSDGWDYWCGSGGGEGMHNYWMKHLEAQETAQQSTINHHTAHITHATIMRRLKFANFNFQSLDVCAMLRKIQNASNLSWMRWLASFTTNHIIIIIIIELRIGEK